MNRTQAHSTLAVSGLLSLVLAGCQVQPPVGNTGGRIDPVRTTPAERADPRVLPASLMEFSDKVAEQLASDLSIVPELNGEYRSTIVFGDIVNKTQIVPVSEFEAFRTRIRGRLMQSQNVLRNVRFTEMKPRADGLIQRETSRAADAARNGARPERRDLDAPTTFFLNGEMYRVERGMGSVNMYLMTFNLMNMDDGTIVWQSTPYEVKQGY